MSEIDIYVVPPFEYPSTTARDITTTAAQFTIVDVIPIAAFQANGPVWVSFLANVNWYCLFQTNTGIAIPDPDPAARGSANGQCFMVPANMEFQRRIAFNTNEVKIIADSAGVIRWQWASNWGV